MVQMADGADGADVLSCWWLVLGTFLARSSGFLAFFRVAAAFTMVDFIAVHEMPRHTSANCGRARLLH